MCDRRAVVTYSCATALRGGAYMQIMCRGRKWDLGYGLEETCSGLDMGFGAQLLPGGATPLSCEQGRVGRGRSRNLTEFRSIVEKGLRWLRLLGELEGTLLGMGGFCVCFLDPVLGPPVKVYLNFGAGEIGQWVRSLSIRDP